MKKALIIANMLFASVSVFGMAHQLIPTREVSASSQSENMSSLASVKEKARELFESFQADLKNDEWLSEDARVLYSNLNFDECWCQLEKIFLKNPENGALKLAGKTEETLNQLNQLFDKGSREYEDVKIFLNDSAHAFKQMVKSSNFKDSLDDLFTKARVQGKAKLFYKQVLGDSKLGNKLYKKAEKVIESGEYVKRSEFSDFMESFAEFKSNKIKCTYCDEDMFLYLMVHETGHLIDAYYRRSKILGEFFTSKFESWHVWKNKYISVLDDKVIQSKKFQEENVSIFFETLLRDCYREKFGKNISLESRIYETFLSATYKGLTSEVLKSYDEKQLNEWALIINKRERDMSDQEQIVSELTKHPKISTFVDVLKRITQISVENERKEIWGNLLKTLYDHDYTELSQLFRDIEKGDAYIKSTQTGIDVYSFEFLKNSKKIEKKLPKLDGVDWKAFRVKLLAFRYFNTFPSEDIQIWHDVINRLKDHGDNELIQLFRDVANGDADIGSGHCRREGNNVSGFTFLRNSQEISCDLPELDGLDWREVFDLAQSKNQIYSEKIQRVLFDVIKEANDLKSGKINSVGLNSHTIGAYQAFRLIKEKGYVETIERGESLPIKDVMKELTTLPENLGMTEKSAEEFLNHLKK